MSCAENRWNLSPSKIEILVMKSKKTIAFAERLQFMILEAEIEELLTVATSFVRAKRKVVLKRLMSATRAELAMRSGLMIISKSSRLRTFDKPAVGRPRVVRCFGRKDDYAVAKVKWSNITNDG